MADFKNTDSSDDIWLDEKKKLSYEDFRSPYRSPWLTDYFVIEVVSTYFFVKISAYIRGDFHTRRGSDAGIVTDEWMEIHRIDVERLTKRS